MNRGFSIIELSIAMAVGAIIIGAVVLFVGRGFGISRVNFEQVRITEDARNLLERVSDTIRNARDVGGASWLEVAEQYEISVYANVDADPDVEKVRYFLQQATLSRGVIQPVGNGNYPPGLEKITVVAKSVRNFEQGVPLFTYYASSEGVISVDITLIVDANIFQPPPFATVHTLVTPRQAATPPTPTP